MLYPLEPSPHHTRSHSPKLDLYELQNQLLQRGVNLNNTSNLIKLPSLNKEKGASQKNILNSELFKSILKKSVSLDLSEEARKKKLKSKSRVKKDRERERERGGDGLEETKAQKNKFEHYRKYIESISHENMDSHSKIHSLSAIRTLQPRRTQMPYIRAEKKQCHNKNSSHKYDSIVYDEAFVRIKSPGRLRLKIQTSKSFLNQQKLLATIQQQHKYNSPYKQSVNPRKASHSPLKTKKRKIMLGIMRAEGTETDLFFTPWQNDSEGPEEL